MCLMLVLTQGNRAIMVLFETNMKKKIVPAFCEQVIRNNRLVSSEKLYDSTSFLFYFISWEYDVFSCYVSID